MQVKSVEIGTFEELPKRIRAEDIVLDVGGGCKPLSRANYVLDFLPWDNKEQAGLYFNDHWPTPHFARESWVQWDLCSHQPWPFKDKQFDFKGPRLMRTKIPLHPALSGKVGGGPMIIKVESRLLFVVPGEKIQYIVGSTQRFTSAPDI